MSLLSDEQISNLNKLKNKNHKNTLSSAKNKRDPQPLKKKNFGKSGLFLPKTDRLGEYKKILSDISPLYNEGLKKSNICSVNITQLADEILPEECDIFCATKESLQDMSHYFAISYSWSKQKIPCDNAIILFEHEIPCPQKIGVRNKLFTFDTENSEESIKNSNFLYWQVNTGEGIAYLTVYAGNLETTEDGSLNANVILSTSVDITDDSFSLLARSGEESYLLELFSALSLLINREPEPSKHRRSFSSKYNIGENKISPIDIKTVTFTYLKSKRKKLDTFIYSGEKIEHSHRYQVREHTRRFQSKEGVRTTTVKKHTRGPEDKPFIKKTRVYKF